MRQIEVETIRVWLCGLELGGDEASIRSAAVEIVDDYTRMRHAYEPWPAEPLAYQISESEYERYEETGEVPSAEPSTLALAVDTMAYLAVAAAATAAVSGVRLAARIFGRR